MMSRNPNFWCAFCSGLAVSLVACFAWIYQNMFAERETTKLLHSKAKGAGEELRVEGMFNADLEISSLFRGEISRAKDELVALRVSSESELVEFRGRGLALVRGIDENIQSVENLSTGGIRILGYRNACDPQSRYAIKIDIAAGGLRISYSDIAYGNYPLDRIPGVVERRSKQGGR